MSWTIIFCYEKILLPSEKSPSVQVSPSLDAVSFDRWVTEPKPMLQDQMNPQFDEFLAPSSSLPPSVTSERLSLHETSIYQTTQHLKDKRFSSYLLQEAISTGEAGKSADVSSNISKESSSVDISQEFLRFQDKKRSYRESMAPVVTSNKSPNTR